MSTATATPEAPTLAPTDWADPTGKGIMEAMDEFFDGPSTPATPAPEAISAAPDKPAETPPASEPAKTPETPVAPVDEPVPTIDEEFFSDEPETPPDVKEEEVKPGEFDEKAFDKETEESTKGMEAKAGEKFKALRAELKQAKQTTITPDVQQKLADLEIKAQEAEGLRARLEEVSSQSAKLKVEASDDYEREIVNPAKDIFAKADELAALYETDATILKAIIKETDRKVQNELIAEHLKDFSDFDRNEIYLMTKDFNGLVAKRERMMANADKEIERQQVARIEQEKQLLAEQRRAVQTIQKDIWSKYKDIIPGLMEDGEDTPEFRKLMGKALSIDFGTAKARDQAYAAFSGVVLPHVVKELGEMRKRLAAYEKGDAKKQRAAPQPSGSVSATPATPAGERDILAEFANMDFSR
jgi:hypothetical protein